AGCTRAATGQAAEQRDDDSSVIEVSTLFCGDAMRALNLWVELRRLIAVHHAVVTNHADPSVPQRAKILGCGRCPLPSGLRRSPCREKQQLPRIVDALINLMVNEVLGARI